MSGMPLRRRPREYSLALLLSIGAIFGLAVTDPVALAQASSDATTTAPPLAQVSKPTGVLAPADLQTLLPPSVFFQGQTAPLQLRNAGAVRFADGAVLFAALVDNSGYATSVRERYQFYFVTETPLIVAGKAVAPGAYGAGFLDGGQLLLMDIGGHDLLTSTVATDATLRRPRPLQLVQGIAPGELRLYLGRQYAVIERAVTR